MKKKSAGVLGGFTANGGPPPAYARLPATYAFGGFAPPFPPAAADGDVDDGISHDELLAAYAPSTATRPTAATPATAATTPADAGISRDDLLAAYAPHTAVPAADPRGEEKLFLLREIDGTKESLRKLTKYLATIQSRLAELDARPAAGRVLRGVKSSKSVVSWLRQQRGTGGDAPITLIDCNVNFHTARELARMGYRNVAIIGCTYLRGEASWGRSCLKELARSEMLVNLRLERLPGMWLTNLKLLLAVTPSLLRIVTLACKDVPDGTLTSSG